jgi:hypothetical protein
MNYLKIKSQKTINVFFNFENIKIKKLHLNQILFI